jgi:hypothetical protein
MCVVQWFLGTMNDSTTLPRRERQSIRCMDMVDRQVMNATDRQGRGKRIRNGIDLLNANLVYGAPPFRYTNIKTWPVNRISISAGVNQGRKRCQCYATVLTKQTKL